MPNPTRLLRRWPRVSEAEMDAARSATLARLEAILDPAATHNEDAATPAEAAETAPAPDAAGARGDHPGVGAEAIDEPGSPDGPMAAGNAEVGDAVRAVRSETPSARAALVGRNGRRNGHESSRAARVTPPIVVVGDADPDAFPLVPVMEVRVGERDGLPATGSAVAWNMGPALFEPAVHVETPIREDVAVVAAPATPARRAARPGTTPGAASWPGPSRAHPSGSLNRGRLATRPATGPVAIVASCPYCGVLLDPPPEGSRRCARCRQRIIVKRVDGRAVYLTEAAVAVFEAERRRVASQGRWTRDRGRWLKLATSVGAPAGRIGRLERAALSDEVVAAARSLYETTVDRQIRAAKRGRRWDEASRLYLDQALALYRIAGSPVPPSDDSVSLHREGALAALRGLGDIAKEAALIGATCCEACQADDGRSFRISRELREPRLPHPTCPRGLCRCRWDLTDRDRDTVGGYLRRHARQARATPSSPSR